MTPGEPVSHAEIRTVQTGTEMRVTGCLYGVEEVIEPRVRPGS